MTPRPSRERIEEIRRLSENANIKLQGFIGNGIATELLSEISALTSERDEARQYIQNATDCCMQNKARAEDLEEVLEDKRRLTRELDVAMNGEEGAAKQASLCDLVSQAKKIRARAEKYREALEFYADRENWDDDKFNPTIWDDGDIDLGKRAKAALAEGKE